MIITLEQAVKILVEDGIVAIPTDTVYGLAVLLEHEKAINSLSTLKQRPHDNPFPVLISSLEQAEELTSSLPDNFYQLTNAFWPGALTLVVSANEKIVPKSVRAGLKTVGIRMPNHPLALKLIEKVGPLVAPSANLSGTPSSTSPEHIMDDFGRDFPILGHDPCQGIESTLLIAQDDSWLLARQGAITRDQIEQVLGIPIKESTSAPGKKHPHYAPKAKIILGDAEYHGDPAVVIGFEGRVYPGAKMVYTLGNLKNPETIAANLYAVLRQLDQDGITSAWVDHHFPKTGILATVSDRIKSIVKHGFSRLN